MQRSEQVPFLVSTEWLPTYHMPHPLGGKVFQFPVKSEKGKWQTAPFYLGFAWKGISSNSFSIQHYSSFGNHLQSCVIQALI